MSDTVTHDAITHSLALLAQLHTHNAQHGLDAPPIELQHHADSGTGVYASRSLGPEQVVLTIPSVMQLRPEQCDIATILPLEDGWLSLVLMLFHEWSKGSTSKHYTYLQSLPASYDMAHTLFWNETQLSQLTGTTVFSQPDFAELEQDFYQFILPFTKQHQQHFNAAQITVETYKRLVGACMSRPFRMEDGNGPFLIPLGDCVNMSYTHCNCTVTWNESGDWILSTTKPVAKGEQLYILYSDGLSNASLLARYGFTLDENPYKFVEIEASFIVQLIQLQQSMSEQNNSGAGVKRKRNTTSSQTANKRSAASPTATSQLDFADALDTLVDELPTPFFRMDTDSIDDHPALLAFVATNLQLIPIERYTAALQDRTIMPSLLQSLTTTLRQRVYESLSLLLHSRIKLYPTSLQQDEAELQQLQQVSSLLPDQYRLKMALQVRIG